MRIAIIGYSGSGKSTLAWRLGSELDLSVLHLDTVHWLPGWRERAKQSERAIVRAFLDENAENGWVIDGNYSSLLHEERMAAADLIIFLDFPRRICLPRAWKRFRQNKGKTRASMTEGCDEKFDLEFVKWILIDGRNKKRRGEYERIARVYSEKVFRCKNDAEVEKAVKAILRR